jgi:hypothetical protein
VLQFLLLSFVCFWARLPWLRSFNPSVFFMYFAILLAFPTSKYIHMQLSCMVWKKKLLRACTTTSSQQSVTCATSDFWLVREKRRRRDKEVVGNLACGLFLLNMVVSDASSPIVSMESVRGVPRRNLVHLSCISSILYWDLLVTNFVSSQVLHHLISIVIPANHQTENEVGSQSTEK